MHKLILASASIAVLICAAPAISTTPEERGLEIAKEVDRRDRGFGSSTNNIKMTLRDKYGNERPRYIRNRTKEQENDGDKSIVVFDNPGDVKGTAFLSHTHKVGSDDQWLYLPALRKVKRISSSNKAGAFMNSEFSYEDISSQEVEKYTYKFLREDQVTGLKVYVSEADPVDPKSGYSKLETYIDAERYIPLKIDFYDRGGRLKKTLVMDEYNQYKGKYWRADVWTMTNHQTGKVTILNQSEWNFDNAFTDKDFDKNSLSRVK
ncbi:MAG: outer membrane lipoprotein-sorting protein [Agarilytica sp.]